MPLFWQRWQQSSGPSVLQSVVQQPPGSPHFVWSQYVLPTLEQSPAEPVATGRCPIATVSSDSLTDIPTTPTPVWLHTRPLIPTAAKEPTR